MSEFRNVPFDPHAFFARNESSAGGPYRVTYEGVYDFGKMTEEELNAWRYNVARDYIASLAELVNQNLHTYGTAVEAIVSHMENRYYCAQALDSLRRGEDSGYYHAIEVIASGEFTDYDKYRQISRM